MKNKFNTCYFHSSWQDMHAIIPCCSYDSEITSRSYCVSEKDCEHCLDYFPCEAVPNIRDIINLISNPDLTTDEWIDKITEMKDKSLKIRKKYSD